MKCERCGFDVIDTHCEKCGLDMLHIGDSLIYCCKCGDIIDRSQDGIVPTNMKCGRCISISNRCDRCYSFSHSKSRCYAKYDIYGRILCKRCDRWGHGEESCYASTDRWGRESCEICSRFGHGKNRCYSEYDECGNKIYRNRVQRVIRLIRQIVYSQ